MTADDSVLPFPRKPGETCPRCNGTGRVTKDESAEGPQTEEKRRCWQTHLWARGAWAEYKGRRYVEPKYTDRVAKNLTAAIEQHGVEFAELAGYGIFLDPWHRGEGDAPREYLEPWRAWSMRGRGGDRDNVSSFAELALEKGYRSYTLADGTRVTFLVYENEETNGGRFDE